MALDPTLVRKGTKVDAAVSDPTINPGYPASVAAGETLLLIRAAGDTLVSLSGWSPLATAASGSVDHLQVLSRVADGSETGSLSVSNSTRGSAQILAVPDAGALTTSTAQATVNAASLTIPAITAVAGSLLIYAVGGTVAADTFTGDAAAHTEIEDFGGSAGRSGAIYRDNALGGTGTRTVTPGSGARRMAAVMIRLAPVVNVTGTGSMTTASPTLSGSGTVTVIILGTGSMTAEPSTLSGSGTVTGEVTGGGTMTVASPTMTGSGTVSIPGPVTLTEVRHVLVDGGGSPRFGVHVEARALQPADILTGGEEVAFGVETLSSTGGLISLFLIPSSAYDDPATYEVTWQDTRKLITVPNAGPVNLEDVLVVAAVTGASASGLSVSAGSAAIRALYALAASGGSVSSGSADAPAAGYDDGTFATAGPAVLDDGTFATAGSASANDGTF